MGRRVWVEVEEFEDMTTDELLRELAQRGRETVLDALIAIKTGRVEDGCAILEREFFPRYDGEAECQLAYDRVMAV